MSCWDGSHQINGKKITRCHDFSRSLLLPQMYDLIYKFVKVSWMIATKRKKSTEKIRRKISLLKVLNNIEETFNTTTIISPFFKLSNAKKYYGQLLGHLNPDFVNINSTHLKEKALQLTGPDLMQSLKQYLTRKSFYVILRWLGSSD